ncbi:MAG: DUF6607 family protein [Daejeonella sp.]
MKKLFIIVFLISAFNGITNAQTNPAKKEEDKKSIKSMCGCYEVSFKYAETFTTDTAYQLAKIPSAKAVEWVVLAEETPDKLVLQHVLSMGKSSIKHWRQDWIYQNTNFYSFWKNASWKFTRLSADAVKGQWTQKVYEVDDQPRYEGSATWIHADGNHFWENTTDAPLPRREYTKRSDYNVLKRTNKHEITANGWVHDQDNLKVQRDDNGNDKILVAEKGINTYTKVDNTRCTAAKEKWDQSSAFWKDVRIVWDDIFKQNKDISLNKKVNDKLLYEPLFEMSDEFATKKLMAGKENQAKIEEVIMAYIK